jgi:hypothetical protein
MALPAIPRLKHRVDTLAAVAGHDLTVEDNRGDRPAKLAELRQARQGISSRPGRLNTCDVRLLAHVNLGALAVELRLSDVPRVREPARIFEADREHPANKHALPLP